MTAEQERAVDRWLKEFTDHYLTHNLDRYAWREINGIVTFVFMFQIAGSSFFQVTMEYPYQALPTKLTKFWMDIFAENLDKEIHRYFFEDQKNDYGE